MFKFIHTADIHLDSPLKSLALRDSYIAEVVGGATRRTFENIINLCLEESVHALIIAGDLYDGNMRSIKTAAFLSRQIRRLEEANIQVFVIKGNHDSESAITPHLDLPKNVHTFSGQGSVKELRDHGVAIHGVSYAKSKATESLLRKYKPPITGLVNIGIMHTSLSGAEGHNVYSPCTVSDLVNHGYEYWALGHIHRRHIYRENPFIVMPGIPQGRDIGESGPKSVTIVKISDKTAQIDERFVAECEFQRLQVNLTDIAEWQMAIAELQNALEKVRSNTKARYAICRITVLGKSPLYWRMHRDRDLFEAHAKEAAQQLDNVLVDGIDNSLEPPASSTNNSDPIDELRSLMETVAQDSAFQLKAAKFLESTVSTLPAELRPYYGEDQESGNNILQQLLCKGSTEVIASLKGSQFKLEDN